MSTFTAAVIRLTLLPFIALLENMNHEKLCQFCARAHIY
jgi:hypothetical protein